MNKTVSVICKVGAHILYYGIRLICSPKWIWKQLMTSLRGTWECFYRNIRGNSLEKKLREMTVATDSVVIGFMLYIKNRKLSYIYAAVGTHLSYTNKLIIFCDKSPVSMHLVFMKKVVNKDASSPRTLKQNMAVLKIY